MTEAEAKKVLENSLEQIKNAHHRGKDFIILAGDTQFWTALTLLIQSLQKPRLSHKKIMAILDKYPDVIIHNDYTGEIAEKIREGDVWE